MANPEHLKILMQGVEVWNRWREENPEIEPDLKDIDFSEVNFCGADLQNVNLYGADFSAADISGSDLSKSILRKSILLLTDLSKTRLIGADLSNAEIRGADLRYANLRGANLLKADLREVDLCGADLCEAELILTDFRAAHLKNVNLEKANCRGAIFADIDLCETNGLDAINHLGPSTIGFDALYKSKGSIPEIFLRGCGIPDQMIEYASSLAGSPIENHSCFISYSSKDEEFAKRLYNDLQSNNVRSWLACEDIKIGDEFRNVIDSNIRSYDKLLLILSEHSVESEWVKDEVEQALFIERQRKKNNVLFPVRLDDVVMKINTGWPSKIHLQRQIGDFTRWRDHDAYSKAFGRLLRDLKAV